MQMSKQLSCAGCFGVQKDSNAGHSAPVELPLVRNCYQVSIYNGAAEVHIIQTYVNRSEKYLELQYKFPVSPNSCLHKFVAIFSKTRMEGVIKEKEIAKMEYEEAIKMGKKAALGEVDAQSRDIFTLQIGNIGPGEDVKIQLSYTQELCLSFNTFYQFSFATKNSPRYLNSIPPQDYINAFRNSVKTIGGDFEWDFKLRLRSSRKITAYKSLTHQLVLEKNNDQNTDLLLTLGKGETLAKTFSFIYTTQEFEIPSYTLGRTDAGSSVMVSFIPKFCSLDVKDAELAALKSQNFDIDIDSARGEYIFLLDRSGSMGGQPIEKAKEALILFLKSLPIDTYFQVVSFGSNSQQLFGQSQKNSNSSIKEAIDKIKSMTANMGGTEIFNPLNKILKSAVIEGHPKQIFLLTDGGVSNTETVIDLVKKNVRYSRVHTIGVGSGVSHALIIKCAEKGKGKHIFIDSGENPSQKIIQLLNQSLTPVISNVSLKYNKDIVESIVPNPEKLPYILKGEVANFYVTFKGQLAKPTTISLSYTDSLNNLPFQSQIEVLPDSESESFVDKLANFRIIQLLEEAEFGNVEDYLYFTKCVDKKQQIIDLSIKHQILSKYTAFICVEKELIDGKYQEIAAQGKEKVQIVQLKPKSISNLFGFGNTIASRNISRAQPQQQLYAKSQQMMGCMISPPTIGSSSQGNSSQDKKKTFNELFGLSGPVGSSSNSSKIESKLKQQLSNDFSSLSNVQPSNSFSLNSSSSSSSPSPFQSPKCELPPPPPIFSLPPPPAPPTINLLPPPPSSSSILPPHVSSKPILIRQIQTSSMKSSLPSNRFSQCNLFGASIIPSPPKLAPSNQLNNQIQRIVSLQQFDGKWSNLQLVQELYGFPLANEIGSLEQKDVVITFLLVRWIEKNSQQSEYILIIKKALSWLKKQSKYKESSETYTKYTQ